jgi:formylglycine-generating enzyme required for sulfatase activity
MKKLCFLACICLLCALPTHAQKKKKNLPIEATVEVPNGVWIDTLGLFADQTEVANVHWLEYGVYFDDINNFHEMPEEFSDFASFEREALLPDTTVWYSIDKHDDKVNKTYAKHYFRSPTFRFFPVVGVTQKQAQMFCDWRSRIVNRNLNNVQKGLSKNYHIEVTYRLPTEKEWEIIAKATTNDTTSLKTKKEQKLQKKRVASYVCGENQLIADYIFNGLPNEYGIYNTIGNVAEMVQEEGIAKGGSWFHTLEESAIKERQTYTKPTAWLGFRCVATVKLTPKAKAGKAK